MEFLRASPNHLQFSCASFSSTNQPQNGLMEKEVIHFSRARGRGYGNPQNGSGLHSPIKAFVLKQ